MLKVNLNKVRFNAYVLPYKHARAGEEVQVHMVNLDEPFEVRELASATTAQYTLLPSADGDENGLMVEWYGPAGMWTVFYFNTKSPYLRRYQVRWDQESLQYIVVDTLTAYKGGYLKVGSTFSEAGAKIMAHKRNQKV